MKTKKYQQADNRLDLWQKPKWRRWLWQPFSVETKPLVAISACLAGFLVRYDGKEKGLGDSYQQLAHVLMLKPLCPEVDAGLSVPRDPIQRVLIGGQQYLQGRDDATIDETVRLRQHSEATAKHLATLPLCGYIFKSRSPSCGVNSNPLFDQHGEWLEDGAGFQVQAIESVMPWLPLYEEINVQENLELVIVAAYTVKAFLYSGVTKDELVERYAFALESNQLNGSRLELLQLVLEAMPRHLE